MHEKSSEMANGGFDSSMIAPTNSEDYIRVLHQFPFFALICALAPKHYTQASYCLDHATKAQLSVSKTNSHMIDVRHVSKKEQALANGDIQKFHVTCDTIFYNNPKGYPFLEPTHFSSDASISTSPIKLSGIYMCWFHCLSSFTSNVCHPQYVSKS